MQGSKSAPLLAALVIAAVYMAVMGVMIFRNNDNSALLTASFIDSGSLLLNYIQLLDIGSFNQSKMYHTSIYGWPGNHITLWALLISGVEDFKSQAIISRSLSFLFSIAAILVMGGVLRSRGYRWLGACLALLFMVTWAPFAVFSYEIHPEAFGIFFGAVCLLLASEYSKTLRSGFLYGSWAAAVFAFLSKQPFLVFLVIPAFLALDACRSDEKSGRVFFKFSAGFCGIALVVTALSHPYIFLDFAGFLEKQKAIHSHHLSISNTVLFSLKKWTEIGVFTDPWYALTVLVAVGSIVRSDDRFIKACAWAGLAFTVVLVVAMKFFFIRSYLYPALPIAVVLIGEAPRLLGKGLWRSASYLLGVAALVLTFHNLVKTAGVVAIAKSFSETTPVKVMQEFAERGDKQTTVVYSANLPLDGGRYKWAYNNFMVQAGTAERKIDELNPDLLIVDRIWPHSEQEIYSRAAARLGMEHYSVSKSDRALACGYQQQDGFLDCLTIALGKDYSKTDVVYDIYLKSSKRVILENISGLNRE